MATHKIQLAAPVLAQVQNFSDPGSLAGLSVATVLLSLAGNGLMVPRALLTRDAVWLTGSAWATAMGWAQLLSMFAGRSASGCARHLGLQTDGPRA